MSELNKSTRDSQNGRNDMPENIRLAFKQFRKVPVLIVIAALALVVLFWTAWFTVQPEETGIVQRFGKVMHTADPGLHFKIPFGIDTVRLLPTARMLKAAQDPLHRIPPGTRDSGQSRRGCYANLRQRVQSRS